MRHAVSSIAFAVLGFGVALSAIAQDSKEAVAIVEEISPGVKDLQRFDLISDGRAIDLGKDGRVVLGYLKSCWQDSVTGGRVIVEQQKSLVYGGELSRRRVECDAAGLSRMTSEASARGGTSLVAAALPEPDLILHGRSPIVVAARSGTLLIERLDAASALVRIDLSAMRFDLSEKNVALETNGLYRLSHGNSAIVVRVDALAEAGRAPAAGRLVIFR